LAASVILRIRRSSLAACLAGFDDILCHAYTANRITTTAPSEIPMMPPAESAKAANPKKSPGASVAAITRSRTTIRICIGFASIQTSSVPNKWFLPNHAACLRVSACRSLSATVDGEGLSVLVFALPVPNGLVICAHSILASMARNSSGIGIDQAKSGDQPNHPVATA